MVPRGILDIRPHDAFLVYDEVRSLGEIGIVLAALLLDDTALEVRKQGKLVASLLGPRPVRLGRVHARRQDPRALLLEGRDLLLHLTPLVRAHARPVAGVEEQNHWSLPPRLLERALLVPSCHWAA